MKVLGIRDIIGPIMIGPSSSHTAGALRIALMCRRLLAGEPRKATFTLYGSFAHTYRGHGTDKALVAGLLGMATDDLRIRDSVDLAHKAGLDFSFVPAPDEACEHPNTVDIEVTDETGSVTSMRGESIGGGAAVISRINGIDVRLSGEYHSIVVKQRDAKGVLAHIATCLNVFDVNIATTSLFRERKGDIAFTIMETDDEVDESIARAIAKHPDIYDVRIVKSDRATDAVPPQTTQSNAKPKGFGADLTPEAAADLFEQLDFPNAATMLAYCEKEQIAISEATCRRERCMLASNGIAVDDTRNYLIKALETMRESATGPLCDPVRSMGGLIGGEAAALSASEESGPCGALLARATTYAMAVLETNASMGRIVAAPTAGSCLPGRSRILRRADCRCAGKRSWHWIPHHAQRHRFRRRRRLPGGSGRSKRHGRIGRMRALWRHASPMLRRSVERNRRPSGPGMRPYCGIGRSTLPETQRHRRGQRARLRADCTGRHKQSGGFRPDRRRHV